MAFFVYMEYQEILRSFFLELVETIWDEVSVYSNNNLPTVFTHQRREYKVKKIIDILPGHFKDEKYFLVETHTKDIFCLLLRPYKSRWFWRDQWILYFRVIKDEELMKFFREERKMIVNVALKKLGDFHGHICPDLVVGSKACELAESILGSERLKREGVVVYAQNVTSALDAIQYMLGCTIGNRRLLIEDWGRHIYRFILCSSGEGIEMELKKGILEVDEGFIELEKKIAHRKATIEELSTYQVLLDKKVKKLITLSPEEMFSYSLIKTTPPQIGIPTGTLICGSCGDVVIMYAGVETKRGFICKRCLSKGSFEN